MIYLKNEKKNIVHIHYFRTLLSLTDTCIYMYDERQANASSMQNFIILIFLKSDKDLFLFLIISNKVLRQTLEHDIAMLQLL